MLIASPRQEVRAADLAAGLAGLGSSACALQTAQPVLDQDAVRAYRNRLKRLDAEGDEQESRAERDWLVAELARAAGLGGRPRSFPDQGERARVAVGKAIRRALARITAADAIIGAHLRESVHTGTRCSYWPG